MKVLNLYAGIGGNRKLWRGVEVTSVEYNEEIAEIYREHYPNDELVIGDAHEYLLKHYKEFDFIWASPPCPSHSRIRQMASKNGDYDPIFPEMTLWQEIIFLEGFCKGKYVVENVIPYYEPLVKPTIELQRHLFWTNFKINKYKFSKGERIHNHIKPTDQLYGYDLSKYKIKHDKIKILRNMVDPEIGLYIFDCARGILRQQNNPQATLF
jgi:DNA (cytosine-5)-methyltransferase 1